MIVTATEVQNRFGKYLKLSQYEEIIITRNGEKIAKLLPYTEERSEGRWIVGEGSPAYKHQEIKVSYEEYLKMTETGENRYEYIDGEIILMVSPLYPHQKAVSELFLAFGFWFEGKKCKPLVSPFDVTLFRLGREDRINVVQPDILVICDHDNLDEKGHYRGTPSLVVEVLSESTRSKDLIKKLELYMESGVSEYWIVDTDAKQVTIHVFDGNKIIKMLAFKGEEYAESFTFPGLRVEVKKIF